MVNKTNLGGGAPFVPPLSPTGAPKPKAVAAASVPDIQAGSLFSGMPGAQTANGTLTGSISTHFPIDDLGSIETKGRWATGFSLDGGSVRLMWVSARRVNDEANKKGFELSFFLQGPAIAKFKERMQKRGATSAPMPFHAGDLAPNAAAGKDTLVKNSTTWSPGGQALMVHVDDKYTVHLVESAPEALKGAVRIRVYGDDAQSNASFSEVVNKLGLQHVFAPPAQASLERFKLARFLWATQPELLEKALWVGPSEVDAAAVTKRVADLELPADHASRKAVASIDLDDPKVAKRASLALLLWAHSPKAFVAWAKTDSYSQHGILPTSGEYGLDSALGTAGIQQGSPEYLAASTAKPSLADARKVFELGLVIKTAPAVAEELVQRGLEQVSASKLEEIIHSAGIDTSDDRLQKIDFREVYPGYFTAYDRQRVERLHEKGARYLYSTLDNTERVFEVLTGGQKSSLTRFQEGRLVQGKSSSSDFGTGGAFSIFTRLVTQSAVDSGKKAKKSGTSGGYYSTHNFNNWGGSRPYKVILNKSVLGRLDWYGYNGDNFGRSTNLKAANHGEAIVETINKSYSGSNELMFPVGNDPKNIDFVVCENQQQKDALLKYLADKGVTTLNGKNIADLVRVETSFFEHPDDLTADAAIRDALETLELKSAETATRDVAGPFAKQHASDKTQAAASAVADEALPSLLQSLATSGGQYVAQTQVSALLSESMKSLSPTVEQTAIEAAKTAAISAVIDPPPQLAASATYGVQSALRSPVQAKMIEILKQIGPAIAASHAEVAKALQPAGADASTVKSAVRSAIKAALLGEGKSAAVAKIKVEMAPEALTASTTALQNSALSTAKQTLTAPLVQAAVDAGKAQADQDGTLPALRNDVMTAATPAVKTGVETQVKNGLFNALKSQVQQKTKPKAEADLLALLGSAAKDAARAAAHDQVKAAVIATAEQFNAASPEKAVSLSGASLDALVEVGLARADAVAQWFAGAEVGKSIDAVLQGAIDGAVQAKAGADHGAAIDAHVEQLLATQLEAQLTQQLKSTLTQKASGVIEEVAKLRAESWVTIAAPALASDVLGQVAESVQNYYLETAMNELINAEVGKIIG